RSAWCWRRCAARRRDWSKDRNREPGRLVRLPETSPRVRRLTKRLRTMKRHGCQEEKEAEAQARCRPAEDPRGEPGAWAVWHRLQGGGDRPGGGDCPAEGGTEHRRLRR